MQIYCIFCAGSSLCCVFINVLDAFLPVSFVAPKLKTMSTTGYNSDNCLCRNAVENELQTRGAINLSIDG